jgi:hypothetical protein
VEEKKVLDLKNRTCIFFKLWQTNISIVKYFFLSDGWTVGRIWEFGGLWNENVWRRKPQIKRLDLSIIEKNEKLWLYEVEEAVLMVEVMPDTNLKAQSTSNIGQVVLKRLISAEQAINRLANSEAVIRKLEHQAIT